MSLNYFLGWKRELVYRTTGDSTSINRANRNGDVYYYSPINRKLRSLREIQEQLDLSLDEHNPLTIESFTFLKQPIGINDRTKELIRDANTKLSKVIKINLNCCISLLSFYIHYKFILNFRKIHLLVLLLNLKKLKHLYGLLIMSCQIMRITSLQVK